MTTTLYSLTEEYCRLMEMAEDPDIEEDVFKDTLDALRGDLEHKAESYACVIANLKVKLGAIEGEMEAIKKEHDRLKAFHDSIEGNIERMKTSLIGSMRATNNQKLKTNRFTLWIQQTTPAVIIDDKEAISSKYMVPQDPKVDKTAIGKDLKAGVKIPWAHLESHDSLRIK